MASFPCIDKSFTTLSPDQIDELLLHGQHDAFLLNAPKSAEFVVNNRTQRLNIRSYWPEGEVKAFALYMHGFIMHANRPTEQYFAQYLKEHQIACITLDFHGHGYSEGTKGLCSSAADLVDDILCVLLALHSDRLASDTHCVNRTINTLPFHLVGHSMGGGATLLVSSILTHGCNVTGSTLLAQQREIALKQIGAGFRGLIAFAPLIGMRSFWKGFISALNYIFPAGVCPTTFRSDYIMYSLNWASPAFQRYVASDRHPHHPHGLTYWGGMHMTSLQTLVDMTQATEDSIPLFSFPLLIVHDPLDRIVKIGWSRLLMQTAPSKDKHLLELENSLHDPLTNRLDYICKLCIEWIESRI
jgi:alpha-beta hydrolase superfamily lysophospholipase